MATVKGKKADVSSVSPSSERLDCGLCVGLYAESGATPLVEFIFMFLSTN